MRTTTTQKEESDSSSLTNLILSHFDAYQRDNTKHKTTTTTAAASCRRSAAILQQQISTFVVSNSLSKVSINDDDDIPNHEAAAAVVLLQDEVVTNAMLQIVDATIMTDIPSSDDNDDDSSSVQRLLELVACFSCGDNGEDDDYEYLSKAVVSRAVQFSQSVMERIRIQACHLLGLCVKHLVVVLNNNPNNKKDQRQCLQKNAEQALLTRVLDKSQAVRQAAIHACSNFFVVVVGDDDDEKNNDKTHHDDENNVKTTLLWSLAHDPSVANRCAAIDSISLDDAETIQHVIGRVRDVKVKVRVKALEKLMTLRTNNNNNDTNNNNNLSQEQYAELIRCGLTDRCSATMEAASKLICTSWMKAVKFDPIALLDLIGPTLYEDECEKVARILLNVAADDPKSTVLDELSNPEIRAFRQGVTNGATINIANVDQGSILNAAQVLFARVKCDQATTNERSAVRRADIIGKIVPDIVVLCEVLQKHRALLVESMAMRQEDDQDNEEAEALEDQLCFVCLQLLQLAKVAGLQEEEGSKRHFVSVMVAMLSSIDTPDDLVEGCIRAMAFCHDEAHFLQDVSEILSELTESDEEDSMTSLRIVSILTVVLENISTKMASNPILVNFLSYILPAVTGTNAMVREAGVSCLGKYALLSKEEMVMAEIKPLLLKVAANEEEKLEIRGQATLAFCDLTLLFGDNMLSPIDDEDDDEEESSSVSFRSILAEMLDHATPAVVAVAAEVAAKLLFADKLHDSILVAQLLVVFFHEDFSDLSALHQEEGDEVKEVGSLVRLQQLLTLFFPAYSIKSQQGRDALVGSIGPLLAMVHDKQTQKTKRGVKKPTWPIVKMVEYVCSTVDMGKSNQQQQQDTTDNNKATTSVESTTKTTEDAQDSDEAKEENPTMEQQVDDDDDETVAEASTILLISVAISQFLSEESSNLTTTYIRALCKFLGGADLDVDSDEFSKLATLKSNMDELISMVITDATSLRSLQKLGDVLEHVASEDEKDEIKDDDDTEDDDDDSSQDSLAEALDAIALSEGRRSSTSSTVVADKENLEDEIDEPTTDLPWWEACAAAEKGTDRRTSSRAARRHLTSANH